MSGPGSRVPRDTGEPGVREVEKPFVHAMAAAERTIYIESQFVTSVRVAEALAEALRARPELEALIVTPRSHRSWLEASTMRLGRIRFMHRMRDAGVNERVRLVYPEIVEGSATADIMVHSKLMIVDDQFLRVGSANLNNRSMGIDSKCDVAIEASDEPGRRAIARVRNRLFGEHCGLGADDVAAALARSRSLITLADQQVQSGRRLRPIDDGELDHTDPAAYVDGVADPEEPIATDGLMSAVLGAPARRRSGDWARISLAAVLVLALILSRQYTPLSALADPDVVRRALASLGSSPWMPLLVLGVYLLAGLLAFPVTLLIAATTAAFGPVLGFINAAVGAFASALLTYAIGAWLGRDT
jgi:phospholipase D1/2